MEIARMHFTEIDSTHSFAKSHAKEFDPKKITCITAEMQTAGRGRFPNRKWISPKGNLYMTLFLPSHEIDPNIIQILAFSIAKVLQEKGIAVQIKWPNDLIYKGKKLGGCMAEIIPEGIIFGIGLNVNTTVKTDKPTSTLRDITGKEESIEELLQKIIQQFLQNIKKGFFAILKEFQEFLAYRQRKIRCSIGEKILTGTLLGVTKKGYLRIQQEDLTIVEIASGEILSF